MLLMRRVERRRHILAMHDLCRPLVLHCREVTRPRGTVDGYWWAVLMRQHARHWLGRQPPLRDVAHRDRRLVDHHCVLLRAVVVRSRVWRRSVFELRMLL